MPERWSRGERWAAGLAVAVLALVAAGAVLPQVGAWTIAAWLRATVTVAAFAAAVAAAWWSHRRDRRPRRGR